jgi:hypothetical protein
MIPTNMEFLLTVKGVRRETMNGEIDFTKENALGVIQLNAESSERL